MSSDTTIKVKSPLYISPSFCSLIYTSRRPELNTIPIDFGDEINTSTAGQSTAKSNSEINCEALVKKAKKVIKDVLYLTLSTCDRMGSPCCSPVYCAYDEQYMFYWTSSRFSEHSANIRGDCSSISAVIYDSSVPHGTGFGVYFSGMAFELSEKDKKEIECATRLLSQRIQQSTKSVEQFLDPFPKRMYKFIPTQISVNSVNKITHEDIRIEIVLK